MVVELNWQLSFAARYSAPPFVLGNYQPENAYKSRQSAHRTVISSAESAVQWFKRSSPLNPRADANLNYTPFAQLESLPFFRRMVSEPSGFVFW